MRQDKKAGVGPAFFVLERVKETEHRTQPID